VADRAMVQDRRRTRPFTALFDLGHPAHFHLFRNTIAALKKRGWQVRIVARQKDCLPDLQERSGWPYRLVRRTGKGLFVLAAEQLRVLQMVVSMAMAEPIDLMLGTSIVIGLASRLTGATSLVFCQDDASVVPLFAHLAYASAHYVITPRSLRKEDHGRKHLTYPGCKELAYLHPDLYRPNPDVYRLLGLKPGDRYFVVRLVALRAHHDIGERGLSHGQARTVIQRLLPHGRVFLSVEGQVPEDLRPYLLPTPVDRIFDVMHFADIIIGDSQTMTIEAAVLGTPALRCNTFVGRLSVLEELEHRYGLTIGIPPQEFDRLLMQVDQWLHDATLKATWEQRRRRMLAESVNLTEWTLDLINAIAEQRKTLRERTPELPEGLLPSRPLPLQEVLGRRTFDLEGFELDASQNKYATRNPVERWVIRRFFDALRDLLGRAEGPILDVGAGEGVAYRFLPPDIARRRVTAMEIDPGCFRGMRRISPSLVPVQGDIYAIPFADGAFDTVMCLEVLEHLRDPEKGLRELLRVSRRQVILSVPWEPVWRFGNLARGQFIWQGGNTPGHIQHWTRKGFIRWVQRFATVKALRRPFPWTMILVSPNGAA